MLLLYIITILLTFCYFYVVSNLHRGLYLLRDGKNEKEYSVSVVVAARNEENNIKNCIESLVNQTYSKKKYEVIVVDDRSTDKTAEVINDYCQKHSFIRLVQVKELPQGIAPKKFALETGIKAAKGEIILTTDADCIASPSWVSRIIQYFEPDVGLVAGFSPLEANEKPSIISRLFTLDSMSLAAVAAGSIGIAKPLTCNGRNLAYRKKVFKSVDGFQKIKQFISGDDDLFLHLVSHKTNWKIRYAIDSDSIVHSKVPESFQQFANQRIRHASKGLHYSNWLKLSLAAVYLMNVSLLFLLPVSIIFQQYFYLWLFCFGIKSISEFFLLRKTAELFHYQKMLSVFPIAMFLHIPYVVIFGLWGQLGKFKWKDDSFNAEADKSPHMKEQQC